MASQISNSTDSTGDNEQAQKLLYFDSNNCILSQVNHDSDLTYGM